MSNSISMSVQDAELCLEGYQQELEQLPEDSGDPVIRERRCWLQVQVDTFEDALCKHSEGES